ncbi:MAG: carbohydrate ABC transporter permease [Acidimicrobiia bacterium]|nr:carbohydrate ABC transporter permease [Acidimicrobiia bacterium]
MRGGLHLFLIVMAIGWLIPVVGAIYSSLRPYDETSRKGFLSLPDTLTLQNYRDAWGQGQMRHHYWMTALIVIPAVLITLLLSSLVAFGVSRFTWRLNIVLLLLFTAGNLLPQQVIAQPLFQMYKRIPLPGFLSDTGYMLGSTAGLVTIHVAFQIGFCTFVLSNYMKTLPAELTEAAMIDGAGVLRQFWQVTLPLCRPALAALATLEFTWVFNDFFWAVLLENQGADRPITSSLANLGGQFFTNDNLVAAGSMLVAFPTILVYLLLQRQFVSGLTLGASKG